MFRRESTADSSFSVSKDPRGNTLGRGTEITMYLKEDAHEFLQQSKLEELVTRYSEFITFPIQLYKKTQEVVEEEDEESETDDEKSDSAEDDITVEDEVEEKDTTKAGKVSSQHISYGQPQPSNAMLLAAQNTTHPLHVKKGMPARLGPSCTVLAALCTLISS